MTEPITSATFMYRNDETSTEVILTWWVYNRDQGLLQYATSHSVPMLATSTPYSAVEHERFAHQEVLQEFVEWVNGVIVPEAQQDE